MSLLSNYKFISDYDNRPPREEHNQARRDSGNDSAPPAAGISCVAII